tara:strand:- start:135 stop:386 length:252 start_codon:yes stop_codon:yes gene_type:complete
MNRDSTFKEISNRLLQLLPLAGNLKSQMQSKINSALKSAFEEFGVITKDELEQEQKTLERAMIRIAELEKQLESLEYELRKKN